MRLRVLGSGSIHPDPARGGPAYLVSTDDHHILLDAGPGALRSLLRAKLTTADLSGVCITHRHPDHCCELNLLVELEDAMGRKAPLRLAGPAILGDYLAFFAGWGRNEIKPPPYPLDRVNMPGQVEWGSLHVQGHIMPHVDHSIGFRIEAGGRKLAYPGDCGHGDQVVELAREVDLLVLECSLPRGVTFPGHLNPEQAADIAERAGVGSLLLTHFTPYVDVAESVAICADRGLEVQAAEDGLEIEI